MSPEICGNQSKQNNMKHWISKASETRPIGDIALRSYYTRARADEKMPIKTIWAVTSPSRVQVLDKAC